MYPSSARLYNPFKAFFSSFSLRCLIGVSVFFFYSSNGHCFDPIFTWKASTDKDLAGYFLYYKSGSPGFPYNGTGAREGDSPIKIPVSTLTDPENPDYQIHGLSDTETYFFTITAYDATKNESGYSGEQAWLPIGEAIRALQVLAGMVPDKTVRATSGADGERKIGFSEAVYALQKNSGLR